MSDDEVLVVLEFHDHPEGSWCQEPLCYQRVEAERAAKAKRQAGSG